MLSEGIYFSLNLGFFATVLWSFLAFRDLGWKDKLKKLLYYLILAALVYLTFYYYNGTSWGIYHFKRLVFGNFLFFTLFFATLASLYTFLRRKKFSSLIIMSLYAPFLFFAFFGMEEFYFLGKQFSSWGLLKVQNPIIFVACLVLLWIRDRKIGISLFLLCLVALVYLHKQRVVFYTKSEKVLYSRYVPYEFFLSSDGFVMEAEPEGPTRRDLRGGLYIEKRSDSPGSDRLYQFNLRNIRKLKAPYRKMVQQVVAQFEFPIVYREKGRVKVYEIVRTYQGVQKVAIIEYGKKGKKLLGPIF